MFDQILKHLKNGGPKILRYVSCCQVSSRRLDMWWDIVFWNWYITSNLKNALSICTSLFFSIIHLYVDSDIFSDNLPNAPYKWERIALILIHLNRYNIYILGILQPKIRFNITNI